MRAGALLTLMRLIIAGSRAPKLSHDKLKAWNDANRNRIAWAVKESGFNPTEIVSGTANGIDRLGEEYAVSRQLNIQRFPADWVKFNKRAGFIRNMQMADYADALLAINYGTPGTANMIRTMRDQHKPVFVVDLA